MTRLRHYRSAALAAFLAVVSLQCSGDNVQPPSAAAIAMAGGDGQSGTVGTTLIDPLAVLVTDGTGDPVQGVTVRWDAGGSGSVSAATAVTGTNGKATVQRTLGSDPGQQTTTATVSGLDGSPVTFVSTAVDGQTPSLALTTQPSASAQSGVLLSSQPVVQLKDPSGADDPQSGVAVTAALASGNGTLGGTLTRSTNANGAASFTDLVITGNAGDYAIRFTASGTAPVVSSTITIGAAGASIVLVTNPPTSALSGEVFDPSVQPAVQVKDVSGAAASGVQVTAGIAAGGGTLEGTTTATTGSDGVAKFGDLGIRGTGDQTLRFTIGTSSVTSSPVTLSALPMEATKGKWGPLVNWDIVPLHMHLLPTGKILAWGKYDTGVTGTMGGRPRLWDPAAGPPTSASMIDVDTMLFCAGHAFMADGTLLVSGGHKADDQGINVTNFFSPNGAWQKGPNMAHGRWYPTVTELPDGRMLTMAGRDENGDVVTIPEIWESNQWVELPGAGTLEIPYYPRNFVDPKNGLIFMAGERIRSRWFDPDGSTATGRGKWIGGPSHIYGKNRDYGTAVMYDDGKILYAGGGGDPNWPTPDPRASVPTASAEMIDLNDGSPAWRSAGTMAFARRHLNSTVLPDGTVLITGGTTGGGFVDINEADAAKHAELWDPKTGDWTTLAANQVMRVYHSVSLLLPDATVLHGASGNAMSGLQQVPDEPNHEIFSPPYLFKGARPVIGNAPASVSYGQTFTVTTANAAQITDVRWIHIGSVTHAFDAGQRANTLAFVRTATGVSVTAPSLPKHAPPGQYMLFILNRNGVPSTGAMIRIH
jgi:galactose oxidase-like protein